ncbi:MAG TPA: hypothetical protein VHM28_09640 [Anaerolineales bacterium]|nr:hypothetical protein [Anaerolineales bacterium]
MNNYRSNRTMGDGLRGLWRDLTRNRRLTRGAAWGLMIVGALLAFEIFNFSTTQFALRDVLGDLTFVGFRWATILAIAFCGIDFAGIARIFTPQQGRDEPAEVWYLFGAWLLAAGFNATLTWWGVSVAIVDHSSAASGAVLSSGTMLKVVPIFVAVMVWLIRVLIIGTFSVAGDNLFSTAEMNSYQSQRPYQQQTSRPISQTTPALRPASSLPRPVSQTYRPAPKPTTQANYNRPEPTYHNLSFDSAPSPYDNEQRKQ